MDIDRYKNISKQLIISGIISLLIGISFFFATPELLEMMIKIFGGILMGIGLINLILYFKNKDAAQGFALYSFTFQALIFFGMGLFLFLNPILVKNIIFTIFGIWFLFEGIVQLNYGIRSTNRRKSYKYLILNGFSMLLIGILLIYNPDLWLHFIGIIVGSLAIIFGIISIIFAIISRKIGKID